MVFINLSSIDYYYMNLFSIDYYYINLLLIDYYYYHFIFSIFNNFDKNFMNSVSFLLNYPKIVIIYELINNFFIII